MRTKLLSSFALLPNAFCQKLAILSAALKQNFSGRLNLIYAMLLWLICMNAQAQSIRYVKQTASGIGDGTSWTNASADLQAMINASSANDEVWVAQGLYYPSNDPFGSASPLDPRTKTFFIKDGVKIFGGFAGIETLLSQRNISTNTTTLSGDIGMLNDSSDNCYSVVLASAASVGGLGVTVDGFTIIKGNAYGGDIININGNDIEYIYGGGIYTFYGNNFISNNTLYNNAAELGGGGIFCHYGTNTLNSNTVYNNSTLNAGGGVCSFYGRNILINNIVYNNSSRNGGGIYTAFGTNKIANNTVHNNSAFRGGGIYIHNGMDTIINNNIYNNSTNSELFASGGGIFISFGANSIINNTIFSNSATSGGGIRIDNGTNNISSNVVFSNSASNSGGGIRIESGTHSVNNNTFYRNNSSFSGGGIFTGNNSTNSLNNNVFWNNAKGGSITASGADYQSSSSNNTFKNNLLQLVETNYIGAVYHLGTGASDNLFAKDPYFKDTNSPIGIDNIHRTADDGLSLLECSPLINQGIITSPALPNDIIGNSRVGNYDIGAYEFQGTPNSNITIASANFSETKKQEGKTLYGLCANLIASVESSGISPIQGNTTAKVWIDILQNSQFVKRHYEITPENNANTATGNVTLYFKQSEFDDFNNQVPTPALLLPTGPSDAAGIANLLIEKRGGISSNASGDFSTYSGSISNINPEDTAIVWNAISSRWEVTFGVSGFSGFWAKTKVSALPLHLIKFDGIMQDKKNLLSWTTEAEQNVSHYIVERSIDKVQNYKPISEKVFAKNLSSLQEYNIIDEYPAEQSYYRLKMVDNDGSYSFSKAIVIQRKKAGINLSAMPNPSSLSTTIKFELKQPEHILLRMIDANGSTVFEEKLSLPEGEFQKEINLSKLPSGIYSLQVISENYINLDMLKLCVVR